MPKPVLFTNNNETTYFAQGYYSAGKPAEEESVCPQIKTFETGLDFDANVAGYLRINLDGLINITSYQNFQGLRIFNPQIASDEYDVNQSTKLFLFAKLQEGEISYYSKMLTAAVGYQKVILGTNEFPFAPANSFTGRDIASPIQFPEYKSVPATRFDLRTGQIFSATLAAAPSSELRDSIPFQDYLILATLASEGLGINGFNIANQKKEADVDTLLGLRANWSSVKLLFEFSHEHDHFFKIGEGEVSINGQRELDFSANLIYPRRETVAAEISGVIGNLIYWGQGSYFYYPDFHQGLIDSPLGEKTIDYDQTVFQEAAGAKYYFPQYYTYIAANVFNGSIEGNGELQQQVVSLSAGRQFLNGDLTLGSLASCYIDKNQGHFELTANFLYRPVAGLKIGLGGRVAEDAIFSLAQPIHGYFTLGYDF